ncbi:MAG: BMP family ABC transporter substrate-binding protein [Burkholderiaceae bacterium]|jgi:simple sugar transport system substrate-binding protein|nr:BMP family ABC transporter substrate-binding protein [Burkholderiaceae bacterium]
MYKNLVTTLAAACALIAPPCAPPSEGQAPASADSSPLKVGFLYVSPVTQAGWTRQHDDARLALQKALGAQVQTTVVENVPEGADAERVLRDLARQGHQLIFTTSFGYANPVLKVAREFPQTKFECLTCPQGAANVATANARFYEGRYLAGIAAGHMSQSHVAGYVAGFPIPEVIQGINAFTLGMRSVNPKATVQVLWLNDWFNPGREREAAMTLMDQGADVLAFHTGSTAVMRAAEERGKLAIAYHSDMLAAAPNAQLLAVSHHWDDYDTRRAREWLQGRWRPAEIWGGVREGMIRVGAFGPKVPAAVRQEVLARQKELADGKIHPFAGPVLDNTGKLQVRAGQQLDHAQIQGMNWLAQGVRGRI